jgi:hypothetical protein
VQNLPKNLDKDIYLVYLYIKVDQKNNLPWPRLAVAILFLSKEELEE